jgi:hydrogenase expression/formation protein HypC
MCLATPALVIECDGEYAKADFGGVRRRICTALTPGVAPGQYVLVHAGMALEILDAEEAGRTLELIAQAFAEAAPSGDDIDA